MASATSYIALLETRPHIQHIINIPDSEHIDPMLPDQCCIYEVPVHLHKLNVEAYTPAFISIGPLHSNNPELKQEKQKQRYFHAFWNRLSNLQAWVLEQYNVFLVENKEKIGNCYSKPELCKEEQFVNMILLDSVFIMELFLRKKEREEKINEHKNDYMFSISWICKTTQRDLLLLENQLPMFVLEELHNRVWLLGDNGIKENWGSFLELAFNYFEDYYPRDPRESCKIVEMIKNCKKMEMIKKCEKMEMIKNCKIMEKIKNCKKMEMIKNSKIMGMIKNCKKMEMIKNREKMEMIKNCKSCKHLTDFIRYTYLPRKTQEKGVNPEDFTPCKELPFVLKTATKLNEAGVSFERVQGRSYLEIKFDDTRILSWFLCLGCLPFSKCFQARLQIPLLKLDQSTECVLRNLIALEQCHYSDQPFICNYVSLIDSLIHTVDDVELLVDNEAIVHELGSHKELATMINGLCKHVVVNRNYYGGTIKKLDDHYKCAWKHNMGMLRSVYFRDPWRLSSTVVGFAVFLFAAFNFLRIIGVLHPNK